MRRIFTTVMVIGSLAMTYISNVNALTLTSPAFANNQAIPRMYTCSGQNVSPPLAWSDIPHGTESFALIMHDIDVPSGDFSHWVIYNIPIESSDLAQAVNVDAEGLLLGKNSWGQSAYRGPCPPKGLHHYVFDLYALNQPLYVEPGLTAVQLQQAMQNNIIAKASLVGTYSH